MFNLTAFAAVSLIGAISPALPPSQGLINPLDTLPPLPPVPGDVAIREAPPKPTTELRFICTGCNENETKALAFFQDHGIKDRNALATIMGNIRQESSFHPNICEGGARTTYEGCRAGGFGFIQLTCRDRYLGLGRHARATGTNPTSPEAQLSYIVTEPQWKSIETRLKTPGKSIDRYMGYAYRWLGWGHKGQRTAFAQDYARRFTLAQVP